jgi:hypothetical protein
MNEPFANFTGSGFFSSLSFSWSLVFSTLSRRPVRRHRERFVRDVDLDALFCSSAINCCNCGCVSVRIEHPGGRTLVRRLRDGALSHLEVALEEAPAVLGHVVQRRSSADC